MKILITGSAGFIGTRLCKNLRDEEIDFVSYDLQSGNDIRDLMKLDKLFEAENFDMVIHLAALAGVRRGEEFPEEYISTNITGTHNLVSMCQKYKVNKFLVYSSSSVLGGNDEPDQIGLDELDDYNPKSLYAITKVAGEQILTNSGLDYLIVRPFTVYGEEGRPDMVIYKWINQINANRPITIYGDGTTKRGYTYVQDLVDATIKLIKMKLKGESLPEVLHLGGSEVVTLNELLELFVDHLGDKKIEYSIDKQDLPKADVFSSFANTEEAKAAIGFEPEIRFKSLIKQILEKEI